eukprot:6179463-Pleurochrysis_carterae.AAC.3
MSDEDDDHSGVSALRCASFNGGQETYHTRVNYHINLHAKRNAMEVACYKDLWFLLHPMDGPSDRQPAAVVTRRQDPTCRSCTNFINGASCDKDVLVYPPFFCPSCTRPKTVSHIRFHLRHEVVVRTDLWRQRVGHEIVQKLEKTRRAHGDISIKIVPTPLEVFKAMHDMLCTMQPQGTGRHVSVLK